MTVLTRNFYVILEVALDADQQAIEMAYRRLALMYHPDLNQSPSANLRMQEINEAYTTLRHPQKRAKYDLENNIRREFQRRRVPAYPPHDRQKRYYTPPPSHVPSSPPTAARVAEVADEQMVLFYLEHSSFGVGIKYVEGIIMMQPIVSDPRMPFFVEGMILARGQEIPAVDLRRHMGLERQPVTSQSRIILVNVDGVKIGLIVDSVENYITIPVDEVELSPSILTGMGAPFIRGIAKRGFQLIILLDLPALFSRDDWMRLRRF